ncbi:MAG: Stp1/IreP family PP2C-type Ser/Thr phosphatase [Lachnospiraceae bacterium]|nr:Stp1/IreP family PP2C-type Ser/Thr phosphatase [Lachnospiraceae bacterium]
MRSYGLTDIGLSRKFNQDYSLECDEPIGNLDNLYVICDGLGGHNAGEFASENAAEIFFDLCESSDSRMPLSIFREAVNKVNELIYYKGRESEYQGMATTLVAATIRDATAYIINVGDSRAYVVNREEITQITWDHSYVGELIREGKISRDEARFHSKNNVITRAIGAERKVEPDYFQVTMDPGDTLLLCSDGLYNMVSEQAIHKVLNAKMPLSVKAKKLIDMANAAGGKDNIAVVLITED